MTGPDGSDGERSGSPSERATRFSDIASEFADEFGGRSEDDPDPGHGSGSPDADDASERGSESDTDADRWEWIGDDESRDETGRSPSESRASDAPEQSNRGDRLWNDGPADNGPTGKGPRSDEATDDEPIEGVPADGDPRRADADRTAADTDRTAADTDRTAADTDRTEADADRTAADADGAGPEPRPDDRSDETGDRIWNKSRTTAGPAATTGTARSPSDGGVSTESPPTGAPETPDASGFAEDASVLDGKRFDPGTNVLIQSESRSERTRDGCHELLFGREGDLDPYVLLVRYQPMDGERLEDVASEGHRTHVIAVGYAQSVPPAADGSVEVTQINNPNDITRLGIIVSKVTQGWSTEDREIRVCYDSLNVLLNYRDVKNAFRFLHVFLSTFTKTDAVAHFHADPLEGDPQAINTLKPLFDEVVSIDSTGTYME